jgi:RNA polymerase sigma factor (TIGR02999 family)
MAAAKLKREAPGHSLQATALVHEVYLRLLGGGGTWENRAHFFSAAAEAMRRILVERARRKGRLRHGGGRRRVELDDADLVASAPSLDLLALDAALDRLAQRHPAKAELVKLRHFAGLTLGEAAEVLGVSRRSADREWAFARAWLFREISKEA